METSDLHDPHWRQHGTVRFRKQRSMRKSKAKTCGPFKRNRVCGMFSLPHCTWANLYSRFCENTRSKKKVRHIKETSGWGPKECKIQDRSRPSGEEIWKTVHFANLMDLCHLKNAELAGPVVFRWDNVKDEQGHRATFTERGASASQMEATRFLDTTSKLPGMAGEASDGVSACTQVKMWSAPRLLRLPEECPEFWIRIPPRQRPNSWDIIHDPVVLLQRHLYGSPIGQPLLWERKLEEMPFETGWEKSSDMGMSSCAQNR